MKKLTISITDDAHEELLELQLVRKKKKEEKTSLADIAGEVLSQYLEMRAKEKK